MQISYQTLSYLAQLGDKEAASAVQLYHTDSGDEIYFAADPDIFCVYASPKPRQITLVDFDLPKAPCVIITDDDGEID